MAGALALLRDRPQFRALWAALALSYTGSGAALTALILYVQQTRGTGTAVAALLIAATAPRLLGPLAGSVADRVDLRRLMIGADLGQAALFAALALLPSFPAILALVALIACLETTYAPAKATAVPALVGADELLLANSLTGVAANLYVAIGPLVGGLLFAAGGASAALLLNGATFLASAQLTRLIPPLTPAGQREGRARESLLAATRTGLRHALDNRVTRAVTLALLFMFAFLAIDNVALVFLVRDTLDGGATTYGVVSAIFGAGMLIGSVGVMQRSRTSPALLYLVAIAISSIATLATGVAPTILLVAIAQLASGSGNGIEIVASETIFQQHVPRHLLGRVYASPRRRSRSAPASRWRSAASSSTPPLPASPSSSPAPAACSSPPAPPRRCCGRDPPSALSVRISQHSPCLLSPTGRPRTRGAGMMSAWTS